ncbi:unnamed protein product [Oikopleura dioica]|uniref:Uncharacterized protein n=1 Tax=Oikopleura dioica TaxID=34765 RepID=E4XI36_OIKDI|nr:unnamed protein product [Oikopleura dioica]
MKKNGDLKLSKEYIQVLFIDKNGDGKAAKAEAARIEKILKKRTFPGVESLEIENSGKTGALSGAAIFGIIFAIIFASFAGFFVFTRKDSLFMSRGGDFSNPVHSEGDVDLSEMGANGCQTSKAPPAAPKTGKKRAPAPPPASAETVIALETEQFKEVDSKFGTSAEGVINVNYEELDENKDLGEQQVENKNEVSSLSDLKVEG